jgi:hypothetical protein
MSAVEIFRGPDHMATRSGRAGMPFPREIANLGKMSLAAGPTRRRRALIAIVAGAHHNAHRHDAARRAPNAPSQAVYPKEPTP